MLILKVLLSSVIGVTKSFSKSHIESLYYILFKIWQYLISVLGFYWLTRCNYDQKKYFVLVMNRISALEYTGNSHHDVASVVVTFHILSCILHNTIMWINFTNHWALGEVYDIYLLNLKNDDEFNNKKTEHYFLNGQRKYTNGQ